MSVKLISCTCAGVVLGLLLTMNAQARMYKWVDEDGVTHYTQQPPPEGIEAETMEPRPTVDTDEAEQSLRDRQKLLDEMAGERNKKAEEKQQEQQLAREKKEACQKARQRLQSFQNPRVNFVGEDGTRRRVTEEQRQQELKKARDYINENCK